MFNTARLLRETWANATDLAQEIVAMLSNGEPLEHQAPVTVINQAPRQAALTLVHDNDGADVLSVTDSAGNYLGGLRITDGRLSFVAIMEDEEEATLPSTAAVNAVYPGLALGGSGSFWQFTIFPEGLDSQTQESVTVGLLSATAPTAGQYYLVAKVGDSYYVRA